MQQRNRKLERGITRAENGIQIKENCGLGGKKYQTDCLENQRRKSEDLN
jgi:hypothetical protein